METKIEKIGFEIEGEFADDAKDLLRQLGEIKGDGSVDNCRRDAVDYAKRHKCEMDACEFASSPIVVNPTNLDTLKTLFGKLQKLHDKGLFHYNPTCGFHLHVSFNNKMPPELFSKKFVDTFKKAIIEKLPDVYEKRKNNHYATFNVPTREIESRNHATRYRFINLHPAMESHGTIEFRAFPSNQPDEMYKYIRFTLKTINNFVRTAKIKTTRKCAIEFRDPLEQSFDYTFDTTQQPATITI